MKKWLLMVLLLSLVVVKPSLSAGVSIVGGGGALTSVASGAVTQANMRISAVNGTAFTDFTLANVLTDYLNYFLVVKDSAGRVIQGYIKAAGTEETLSAEVLTNPSFDVNTNFWTPTDGTLASIAGGQSNNCLEITRVSGGFQRAYQDPPYTAGKLYKGSGYVKSGSSGDESFLMSEPFGVGVFGSGTSSGSWVQKSGYFVTYGGNFRIQLRKVSATAGTMLFDEVSLKQVLTPSATGVTITSTKGGATFNWEAKDASFNYNDASGYTYTIYLVQ